MIHVNFKNRRGFTMLELVFAIVTLGILAAVAMPRLKVDHTQDAADSILSDIRYTQQLALMDYKHASWNPQWQRRFWTILFTTCGNKKHYYMVGSDDDMTGSNNASFKLDEAAIDPANGKPMFATTNQCNNDNENGMASNRIFITKQFGIQNVEFRGGCSGTVNGVGGTHLGFDHLGRPHYGYSQSNAPNYASYMKRDCSMIFTLSNNETFTINIEAETGYASIANQPGS